MESRLQRWTTELGRVLARRTYPLAAFVALLLVLFGSVPGGRLPLLLALIVTARGALLAAEALRRSRTEDDWLRLHERSAARLRGLGPEERAREAEGLGLRPDASAEEVSRYLVEERRRRYVAPRPGRELAAEGAGLVGFGLLLPLAFVLFTREFVALRSGHGLAAGGVAVACLALYAWPHRWPPAENVGERRSLWWSLSAASAAALVYVGVAVHHPYLHPLRHDRAELAAERVLALENNVVAERHVDRVFAWAAELAARGERRRAIELYGRGLQISPHDDDARWNLAALRGAFDPDRLADPLLDPRHRDPRPRAQELSPAAFARLPLWDGRRPLHGVPPCRLDASLEAVPRTTVVLVPLGAVPSDLVRAVGDALQQELDLPACRVEESLPLPDADRVRGVVFGRQWNTESLARHFWEHAAPLPEAPLKYLLLTGVDLYSQGTNFVFSSSGRFGAVLSYARYGDPGTEWEAVRHRTVKQALGALVKSFGLPPSRDPECVTSYSNGLAQFDAKGNRPNTETFLLFRERVDARDARWRARRRHARPR